MKKIFTHLSLAITVLLCTVSLAATAQTVTPPGPSLPVNSTNPPPATATAVGKILCYGSTILLKGPTGADKYQWYKIDASGTKHMVKESTTAGDNLYSETSTDAGYYNYQLVQLNSNSCTSTPSNIFSVYVMPQIAPVISATAASICATTPANPQASTVIGSTLSVTGLDLTNFTYSYQWNLGGNPIAGATGPTYDVPAQSVAPATLKYTVTVSYTKYPGVTCPVTSPEQDINVVAPLGQPTITFGN